MEKYMALNPFKESDLSELQYEIREFLLNYADPVLEFLKEKWDSFANIIKEHVTIMIVPHNEKKILNYHLPLYAITILSVALVLGLLFSLIIVIDHSYTSKDMSNMINYGINSRHQLKDYKKQINKLYENFQVFKPELSSLYSLVFQNNSDSLWAKGGEVSFNPMEMRIDDSPSIEELNLKELNHELKITNEILKGIRKSLKGKKIIEYTPSIRPVQGYILYKDGIIIASNYFDYEYQKGIEIAAYPGSKIKATAPGRVESIEWDRYLGLSVTIQHKYGFSSIFSHCQNVIVNVNQKINKGQTIGYVGKTGQAEKHMCLYQIKIGNEFIDPYPYIR